jgi:hypothetical protein
MYKTLDTLQSRDITGNETSVKHGDFVFCVRRVLGADDLSVSKHTPGSDTMLEFKRFPTFFEVVEFIKTSTQDVPGRGFFIRVTRDDQKRQWRFDRRSPNEPGMPSASCSSSVYSTVGDGINTWEDAFAHAKEMVGK